jgi:hypothetical protein
MAEVYMVMGTTDGWLAGWFKRAPETLAGRKGRICGRRDCFSTPTALPALRAAASSYRFAAAIKLCRCN